jgi:hypothetical protein
MPIACKARRLRGSEQRPIHLRIGFGRKREIRVGETRTSPVNAEGEISAGKRRSRRIHIAMPVLVRGKSGSISFEETTHTVTVNAHGCMLYLAAQLIRGQQLTLVNPQTREEVPCIVSYLAKKDIEKMEVGIEFAEPSALFWRINFPPEDSNPDERKRVSAPPQRTPAAPRR